MAERLWSLGSWLYPYAEFKHDDIDVRVWEISLTVEATENEAQEAFDRLNDALCPFEAHHQLAPCIFMVGGMRLGEVFCDCEDSTAFHLRTDPAGVYRCSDCELRVRS